VPDNLNNVASYALAQVIGFEKVAETLFFEYELPNWRGFNVK
jgi:hypothetical protein